MHVAIGEIVYCIPSKVVYNLTEVAYNLSSQACFGNLIDWLTFASLAVPLKAEGARMRIQKLLRRTEASEYLENAHGVRCAPSTLAKMACHGGGPTFRRIGPYPVYAA